jgi:hypothetical protein
LVHLAWKAYKDFEIEAGSVVSPEQPVARVGHADTNALKGDANYHLHVSVIRSDKFGNGGDPYTSSDFPQAYDPSKPAILDVDYNFPIWQNNFKNVFFNPFDHNPDKPWEGKD